MKFGEKLQKLRKEKGMSQEELAARLHVSRQAVSKWENDQGYPETEKMLMIGNIFSVTMDYLLKDEGGDQPQEQGFYASRECVQGYLQQEKIEMLVHQMLKKIRIEDNGDSEFLPGTLVDILEYEDANERLIAEGKQPAEGKQIMLGITKASLATNSFLSAASFQETTKVLTEAAIKGKVDPIRIKRSQKSVKTR